MLKIPIPFHRQDKKDIRQMVLVGAQRRIRPALMTSATTILARPHNSSDPFSYLLEIIKAIRQQLVEHCLRWGTETVD